MEIIDYYNTLNKVFNHKKNYYEFDNVTLRILEDGSYYISDENLRDNFHTFIIYKKNNEYTINIFYSSMRNDGSFVTTKEFTHKYDENILTDKLKLYYTKIKAEQIIQILKYVYKIVS